MQKPTKSVKTRSFFILLLGIAFGALPAFATQTEFTWSGASSGNITVSGNWSGGQPTGSGLSTENVTFGSSPNTALVVPTSLSLNNITFTGSRDSYSIIGVGSPTLTLQGNLINASGASLTIYDSLNLYLSDSTVHTVSVATGTQVVVGANISTESGSINKTGNGELDFVGSNNYRGDLLADRGTVTLSGNAATNLSGSSSWTFNNSSVLKVSSSDAGIVGGTYSFNNSSKLSAQVQGAVAGGWLYFHSSSSLQASAGGLESSGDGVITGGILQFDGNSLLKAGVTNSISGGEQHFYENSILTASGADAITGGNQIFSQSDSNTSDLTRLVINQSGSIGGESYQTFYGYSSLQANNQGGGSVKGGTQEFHDHSYLRASYSNSITGGTQIFYDSSHLDANAYHAVGGVEITLAGSSAINVGATEALSPDTEVYFNGEYGGTGGFLHLNGYSTTLAEINSGSSESSGQIDNTGSTDSTLTIGGAGDSNFSGYITDGGGDGRLALTKNGIGTLTLSGSNNDYTGGTTINQGTVVVAADGALGYGTVNVNGVLRLNNNRQLYNDVQVNSGGIIAGNGFASSASINAGGLIAPGGVSCPIGTLSFNDLTLNPGGGYVWNFKDTSSYDQVSVLYATTLAINATSAGGEFTIHVVSLDSGDNVGMATGFTQGQTYNFTIFTANNITGFSTDKFLFDTSAFSTDAGPNAIFSISQSGNNLILSFTPVPEPSTWALLGTGVLAIGVVGWRQRKRA